MKLLSLSLTNIGPFRDQTRTVDFRQGSYLIKAPIGSGKSFLYFDGPTFALYKKNKRPMLNMQSKSGQIVCSFEIGGQIYTIQRDITRTKTGESIKSKLLQHGIIMDFKNEIDLQQTLNGLLPPMEVFLGTQMLMQDTPNIFELEAKDRLEVFKNVFNLLGIDEIKDTIAERKRDITAMIKARADTSNYDQKAQGHIATLIQQRAQIQQYISQYHNNQNISGSDSRDHTVTDWKLLQDKLTIDLLNLPTEPLMLTELIEVIEQQQGETIALQTQQRHLQEQITTKVRELNLLQTQYQQLTREQQQYKEQIASYDPSQLDLLTKRMQDIQTEQQELQKSLDQTHISALIKKLYTDHKDDTQLKDILDRAITNYKNENQRGLLDLQSLLNELKHLAKDRTHQISLMEQAEASKQEQIKTLKEQLIKVEARIASFQHDISGQKLFKCEKINDNCPYIDLINASTFKKLNDQLQGLISDRDQIQNKIQEINNSQLAISNSKSVIRNPQSILSDIKEFFGAIKRQEIDALVIQHQEYSKQSQQTQTQRSLLQDKAKNITTINDKIISIDATLLSLQTQEKTQQEQNQHLSHDLALLQEKISTLPNNQQLTRDKETITNYAHTIDRLSQIITDFKTSQLEVKKLKEDEKILSDLYQIFSRELLLVVVQKNLPQLQDLINSYLSQVVDYQIMMEIDKKSINSDSIDLFVTVIDEQGEREVKSLSGGQKVILKLVWMMAVATIMRSQMLFLDETINNLDGDTIAKVAELLKNFIAGKGGEFMLYVVTHSHQIQEMNIRDETVEL